MKGNSDITATAISDAALMAVIIINVTKPMRKSE